MFAIRACARSAGALFLATLAACSSSDHGTSPDPGTESTPFNAGQLSGNTVGPMVGPFTTTGVGATVTGLVGRFTRLAYEPPGGGSTQPIAGAPVYFDAPDSGVTARAHLWRINFDGTGLRQLTFDSADSWPGADPSSGRVAFWRKIPDRLAPPDSSFFLYTMKPDGSDTARVRGPECSAGRVDWLPNGNLVFDSPCSGNIVENTFGEIFSGPRNGFSAVISDFGKFVMIAAAPDPPARPASKILRINYPGRDTSTLLESGAPMIFAEPVATNATPFRLAFWSRTDPDTLWKLHVGFLSVPAGAPPVGGIRRPAPLCSAWGPDGNTLILRDAGQGGPAQLFLVDTLGHIGRQLTHLPNGVGCPSAGPPDSAGSPGGDRVVLVGESGIFGATASGLIFSQGAGGALRAVVAFRAGNQRSVRLETGTGLNSTAPVLTYTLQADRLKALAYLTLPGGDSVVQAVDSAEAPAATGAFISFDATSGAVALVLPFSSAGSSAATALTDAGGIRTFTGPFLAAYDRNGHNLAPGGAARAELDLRAGTVRVTR